MTHIIRPPMLKCCKAVGDHNWNADDYHRLSGPQFSWGRRVVDRLGLAGHETVLDAGCGSGRVTRLLVERLPRGRVIAVDASLEDGS